MTTRPDPSATLQPLAVLIIEMNPAYAESVLAELTKAGFETSADVVHSQEEVTGQLNTKHYDVVLADYQLPGWKGPDALSVVRQIQKDTPVILVTDPVGDEIVADCIKNGITDFVRKDRLSRLAMSVRRALRERALSEEHARALNALAESELRFRTLVEASPDAIFVNCQSKIVFANLATVELLGAQTKEQIIGKDISEIVHAGDLARIKEQESIDLLGSAPSAPLEHSLIRLDGSLVDVEGVGISVTWKGLPAVEVIDRDISERKRTEKTALEWQKRVELARNAALPIGLWEWDVTTDKLVWSDEVYRQFGFTRKAFRGNREEFRSRIHPDDLPMLEKALQKVIAGSTQYDAQYRVLRPDGSMRWIDSRAVMVREGAPRMIGIAIDITNLKTAEEKLRRSEARYRAIVKDAPYGIYRTDFAKHLTMGNPTIINMLGYETEKEILSLNITRDVYVDPKERTKLWARIRETGAATTAEVKWKRKDGRVITVRNTVMPFVNERGELEGFQAFVEDVTERRMLEKQFWQAQKFEAIDRLAGGIAHDFNNVLMVVGSYAELILENDPENKQIASYANHIRGAADRAAAITRQLLAFSRRQILELEVLTLNTVLTDLGKMLPKLLGEDVTVTISLDPALRRVKVDRGQMEQVVMNLASNARDAMAKGGRFIVTTQNVEADEEYVSQRSPMLPGPYVVLSVTDTGYGMDAETKARIFEPFFTTKERGSGTGLGLASVYGIVKQSGGFIWVVSAPGQGTTFEIYLPSVAAPLTKDVNPNWVGKTSEGSETILLVEDEAELRRVACGFLESKGYKVLVAGDSPEALGICKQHTGRINALVTDLVLPGMDGVEMARAAKTLHPEMRTLYMTGYMDRNVGKLRAGDVLLQKPFKLSYLGNKLREVLAS